MARCGCWRRTVSRVDWVQPMPRTRIRACWRSCAGASCRCSVEIGSRARRPVALRRARAAAACGARRLATEPAIQMGVAAESAESTFERFVEGKSNHFAKAAAMQVAENPGAPTTRCSSTAARAWARRT